jgi:WD repeat-containing protein 23
MEGHSILRTLIKCHFSPEILNGSRFIYTGSADGGIHIFDTTTGKIAAVLYKEATVPIRASCWLPMQNAIVYGDFNSKTAMWTDQPDFP